MLGAVCAGKQSHRLAQTALGPQREGKAMNVFFSQHLGRGPWDGWVAGLRAVGGQSHLGKRQKLRCPDAVIVGARVKPGGQPKKKRELKQ